MKKNNYKLLVKLEFTVEVPMDQLPIKSYVVFWGDGESTVVSGAELNDKPSGDNPFTLYHTYDLNKLKNHGFDNTGDPSSFCCHNDTFPTTGGVHKECGTHNLGGMYQFPENFWKYTSPNRLTAYVNVLDNWDKISYCDYTDLSESASNNGFILDFN